MMMCALLAWHTGFMQIVVVGSPTAAATLALRRTLASRYLPFALVFPLEPGPKQEAMAAQLEFTGAMTLRDGDAAAYVCRDFTCRQPVTTSEALAAELAPRA